MYPHHLLDMVPFQRNRTTASQCLLSHFSPQLVTSLLFLAAIAALGLTLGEDYGPTEGTPSPTKNPTVFYANPVLFAVTWVNTANVISSSSAAPGGITHCALWCLPVRSLCCCVRKGWGGGNEPWTLPRSSFSGSSLLCVKYSLCSPSYGRRSRYEIKYHFSHRLTCLDASSLSNHSNPQVPPVSPLTLRERSLISLDFACSSSPLGWRWSLWSSPLWPTSHQMQRSK